MSCVPQATASKRRYGQQQGPLPRRNPLDIVDTGPPRNLLYSVRFEATVRQRSADVL